MKKILTVLASTIALAALATSAFAQGAGPKGGGPGFGGPGGPGGQRGGGMMGGRMAKMQEGVLAKLNLTPDQKKKVDALNVKRQAEMEKMFKGGPPAEGDRDKMREKMRESQKAYRKDLDKILKPEQSKKYDELMKAEREKMRSQFGGGPGGPGGAGKPGGKGGKGGI
jgi:Spy/CpxP family protein refolding chaperone